MSYQSFYGITDWQNLPSQKTALNRANLLHAETGIKEADNRIVQLDANKVDKATIETLVKSVTLDAKTGILAVTLFNGTKTTYDLDIEKVVTNFDINDQDELILTLADGTVKKIDLTRFVYSVASTSTVSMSIKNRVMTAVVVDGSITMAKLDAEIQQEFRQYLLDSQAARDAALQYQKYAKRYALGDGEFPGSEADNAKYYYEQARTDAATSGENAGAAAASASTASEQAGIAVQKATSATASANSAAADAQLSSEKAAAALASQRSAAESASAASSSATAAAEKMTASAANANLAKRYAVGGVVPEDTQDNAQWYYQQTQSLKQEVDAAAKMVVPRFYIDWSTGKLKSKTAAKGIQFRIKDGKFYGRLVS